MTKIKNNKIYAVLVVSFLCLSILISGIFGFTKTYASESDDNYYIDLKFSEKSTYYWEMTIGDFSYAAGFSTAETERNIEVNFYKVGITIYGKVKFSYTQSNSATNNKCYIKANISNVTFSISKSDYDKLNGLNTTCFLSMIIEGYGSFQMYNKLENILFVKWLEGKEFSISYKVYTTETAIDDATESGSRDNATDPGEYAKKTTSLWQRILNSFPTVFNGSAGALDWIIFVVSILIGLLAFGLLFKIISFIIGLFK